MTPAQAAALILAMCVLFVIVLVVKAVYGEPSPSWEYDWGEVEPESKPIDYDSTLQTRKKVEPYAKKPEPATGTAPSGFSSRPGGEITSSTNLYPRTLDDPANRQASKKPH